METIRALIAETERWRLQHRRAYLSGQKGRSIDAAACAIREQALRDALAALEAGLPQAVRPGTSETDGDRANPNRVPLTVVGTD